MRRLICTAVVLVVCGQVSLPAPIAPDAGNRPPSTAALSPPDAEKVLAPIWPPGDDLGWVARARCHPLGCQQVAAQAGEVPLLGVIAHGPVLAASGVAATPPGQEEAQAAENSDWLREREEQSMALISYPWQNTGYRIEFQPRTSGYRGMASEARRLIIVYARAEDTVEQTAYDLAHEIGHAVDATVSTDARREEWLQIRGARPGTPWFGCHRCEDYGTGAGDFAEVFALWQLGGGHFRSRVAPPPTPAQWEELLPYFWAASPAPEASQELDDPNPPPKPLVRIKRSS